MNMKIKQMRFAVILLFAGLLLSVLLLAAKEFNFFPVPAIVIFCIMAFSLAATITLFCFLFGAQKAEEEQTAFFADVPGCMRRCKYDSGLTLLHYSNGFLQMVGYTKQEIRNQFGNQYINLIYEPDRLDVWQNILNQLKGQKSISLRYRLCKKNGDPVWVLEKGRLISHESSPEFYSILIDITDEQKSLADLERSNERYKTAVQQSECTIFEYDPVANQANCLVNAATVFGMGREIKDFPQTFIQENTVHPDDAEEFLLLFEKLNLGIPTAEGEFRIKSTEGTYLWCKIKLAAIADHMGNLQKAVCQIRDITRQKLEKQSLIQKAQRDELTGLLNRAAAKHFIETELTGGTPRALFMLDVDHFKKINDSMGHMYGDTVLAEIGAGLKKLFRASDILGRLGGDEFIILLKDMDDIALITEKALAIHQCLGQIFSGGPGSSCISGSIGIALYPRMEPLLRNCTKMQIPPFTERNAWAEISLYCTTVSYKQGLVCRI